MSPEYIESAADSLGVPTARLITFEEESAADAAQEDIDDKAENDQYIADIQDQRSEDEQLVKKTLPAARALGRRQWRELVSKVKPSKALQPFVPNPSFYPTPLVPLPRGANTTLAQVAGWVVTRNTALAQKTTLWIHKCPWPPAELGNTINVDHASCETDDSNVKAMTPTLGMAISPGRKCIIKCREKCTTVGQYTENGGWRVKYEKLFANNTSVAAFISLVLVVMLSSALSFLFYFLCL